MKHQSEPGQVSFCVFFAVLKPMGGSFYMVLTANQIEGVVLTDAHDSKPLVINSYYHW